MALKVQVIETPTIECAKQYTPKNNFVVLELRYLCSTSLFVVKRDRLIYKQNLMHKAQLLNLVIYVRSKNTIYRFTFP